MRLRNNPKAQLLLEAADIVIKSFPIAIHKNTVIELGMGKGQMITKLAYENPSKVFIGIEKSATIALQALKKSEQLGLHNFFIINDDIRNLSMMFRGQVQTIWLTFSDPWPKARHEKRRLTSLPFLLSYAKLLAKNGMVKLKTDNDAFFAYSIQSFANANWQVTAQTNDLSKSPFSRDNEPTEYEQKWSQRGKKINYLEAQR